MSEYQFYEFKAIDKPLSQKQKDEIGRWSSRTYPTNTSAVFTYSYGDFPKDEMAVVEKYFDAMFYTSNWGTTRLIFKFPSKLVDVNQLKLYCAEGLDVITKAEFTLIDINISDEEGGGGWIEGEGLLSSLSVLRDDIIAGDYRCLYLIWLKVSVEAILNEWEVVDPASDEPNVPANLKSLNGALLEFIEVFEIDKDAIKVASENSVDTTDENSQAYFEDIDSLSEREKNDFLKSLLQNEAHLSAKFKMRLKQKIDQHTLTNKLKTRTVGEIAEAIKALKENRKAKEKKKLEVNRLAKLKKTEEEKTYLWESIDLLIKEKNSKSYDEAIVILKELKNLAKHKKQYGDYCDKVKEIQQKNNRLSSLKNKIDYARLIEK